MYTFNYGYTGSRTTGDAAALGMVGAVERSYQKGKAMKSENSKKQNLKQRAAHELEEFLGISLYLAFFFCAIVTYRMILLGSFQDWLFHYGVAAITALVIAKVILIGEYAHLGKRVEAKPLLLSSISKAFLFSLLVFGFHILEEVIKRLLHGKDVAGAFREMRIDDLLSSSLIIFCTFIPFFAFRELSRVLGEDKFLDLFFRTGSIEKSDLSTGQGTGLTRNVS